MSEVITMRHPTLPDAQEIEVPRDAMPHYTAAGWQRVPDEELEHRAALKAQAEAEAEAAAADETAGPEPDSTPADETPAPEPAAEPEPAEQPEPADQPTKPARSRAKPKEDN